MKHTDSFLGKWEQIKVGQKVRLDYGCMCGEAFGKVYGKEVTKWGKRLRIKLDDYTFTYVNGITNVGIGTYLVD